MYAEISEALVENFIGRILEGKVYQLKRFIVTAKKRSYRPVEGQCMIRIGKYTSVEEIQNMTMDYPLCTYALTPLHELPQPQDMPENFTGIARCGRFYLCVHFVSLIFFVDGSKTFSKLVSNVVSFVDVVGIITGISPAAQYHSAYRATPSTKRVVYLSDIK